MRPPFIQSLCPKHLSIFACVCLLLLGLKQADWLPTQATPGSFKNLASSARSLADARMESTFAVQKDSLHLHFGMSNPETGRISIRRLGGTLVWESSWTVPVSKVDRSLYIAHLPHGVYFIRFETKRIRTVRVLNLG